MTITGKNARLVIIDDLGTKIDLTDLQKDSLKLWHEVSLGKEDSDHLKVSTEIVIIGAGMNVCIAAFVNAALKMTKSMREANEKSKTTKFPIYVGLDPGTNDRTFFLRKALDDIAKIDELVKSKPNKSYNKFLPKPYNFKRRK